MGRNAIPLSVQSQCRRIHRSNAEIEARASAESSIKVSATEVSPPKYLKFKALKDRFNELASMLKEVDDQLCTALDADALAAYVDAQDNYEHCQKLVYEITRSKNPVDTAELERRERMRNAAQAKCDALRAVLLLDPASRARAAVAKTEEPKENAFARFL